MPWLLAIVTTSIPAVRSAFIALAGARKVYFLGPGVPRVVIAVSRFTTARSAAFSLAVAEPKSPPSAPPEAPAKCTSPAKAIRTRFPPVRPPPAEPEFFAGLLVVGGSAAGVVLLA